MDKYFKGLKTPKYFKKYFKSKTLKLKMISGGKGNKIDYFASSKSYEAVWVEEVIKIKKTTEKE